MWGGTLFSEIKTGPITWSSDRAYFYNFDNIHSKIVHILWLKISWLRLDILRSSSQLNYIWKIRSNLINEQLLLICKIKPLFPILKCLLIFQTMKNLIFLAEVLQLVNNENEDSILTLQWLIRRIRKIIYLEIVQAPSFTVLVWILQ